MRNLSRYNSHFWDIFLIYHPRIITVKVRDVKLKLFIRKLLLNRRFVILAILLLVGLAHLALGGPTIGLLGGTDPDPPPGYPDPDPGP